MKDVKVKVYKEDSEIVIYGVERYGFLTQAGTLQMYFNGVEVQIRQQQSVILVANNMSESNQLNITMKEYGIFQYSYTDENYVEPPEATPLEMGRIVMAFIEDASDK